MATTHELLKARFAYVSQDLDAVMARLTDGDLGWCPAPGMPTMADLLLEIANKELEAIGWLQQGVWPDGGPDAFNAGSTTVDEVRQRRAQLRGQTIAYIDSLSDAQLEEEISCPERWWEALRLQSCPRSEVLRNIAAHEWYHTAQLVTYCWLRGDRPHEWS